jgi:septal ring factor EnvC (AmiA/AmiB activator)
MVVPLITLYNRAQTQTSKQLNTLNKKLQQEIEIQKTKELDLRDAIHDLERFTALSVGREERVIELKAEVNALLKQAKHPPRYAVEPEK